MPISLLNAPRATRFFFDAVSPIYRWLTNNPMWIGSLSEAMRHFPPSGARLRLLDIGCGHGNSSRHFVNVRPEIDVIGLDFSVGMLNMARRMSAAIPLSRLAFLRGDATCLPFPNAAFDAVTAHSLYYMLADEPQKSAFLAECRRVLRPGGRLILLDPLQRPFPFDVLRKRYPIRIQAAVLSWHAVSLAHTRYTAADMLARLQTAGFARVLTEAATDGYGVLSRGEKPYSADLSTPDRITVATESVSNESNPVTPEHATEQIRGTSIFVLIRQTPDRAGWNTVDPAVPIRHEALLASQVAGHDAQAAPCLIGFSSLPNAVAFMQGAVVAPDAPRITKIAKFPKGELVRWGLPLLLNPKFGPFRLTRYRIAESTLTVDIKNAVRGEE